MDGEIWSHSLAKGSSQADTLLADPGGYCAQSLYPREAGAAPCASLLRPGPLHPTSPCPDPANSASRALSVSNVPGASRGAGTAPAPGTQPLPPAPGLTPRPLSPRPLPGKKCTYGIKCKFYHPERPHHTQLAVADELRAQTRTWRGAGADEERPRARAEPGGPRSAPVAAWPGPREPGARSLPPAQRRPDAVGLEGGLSRLALSDDPGTLGAPPPGLAPRPRCPDWGAPAAPLSLPAPPGLPNPRSQSGPLVRPRAGGRLGDPQRDLLPQARPPTDPWPRPHGAARGPGRSAWAELSWGEGAFWGPLGSAAGDGDARARARTELCSIFPPQQVDSVMALFPALSDVTRLLLLIQRFRRAGAPVGNP